MSDVIVSAPALSLARDHRRQGRRIVDFCFAGSIDGAELEGRKVVKPFGDGAPASLANAPK